MAVGLAIKAATWGARLLSSSFAGAATKQTVGSVAKKATTTIGKGVISGGKGIAKTAIKNPKTTIIGAGGTYGFQKATEIYDSVKEVLKEPFNAISELIGPKAIEAVSEFLSEYGSSIATIAGVGLLSKMMGTGGTNGVIAAAIGTAALKYFTPDNNAQTAKLEPAMANNG